MGFRIVAAGLLLLSASTIPILFAAAMPTTETPPLQSLPLQAAEHANPLVASVPGTELRHLPTPRGGSPHAVRIHASGADPWVLSHQGLIYYTHTTGRDIKIWMGHSLEEVGRAAPTVVWKPRHGQRFCSQNIWAPEIHHLDRRWYIYFAADDGRNVNHRMYVLESVSGPLGPYELKGKLAPAGSDRWAIDGTVITYQGKLYYAWSGWPGSKDGRQNLYLARMSNPWTIEGDPIVLSQPEHRWESWINEGPQFLQRGDRLFLVYSANRSWSDSYCLGMLELRGHDPLDKDSWIKHAHPVFQSFVPNRKSAIYAPGHNSFFTDADGNNWLVYHVAKYRGAGWKREVRAQEWQWDPSGLPYFGVPKPTRNAARMHHLRGAAAASSVVAHSSEPAARAY